MIGKIVKFDDRPGKPEAGRKGRLECQRPCDRVDEQAKALEPMNIAA